MHHFKIAAVAAALCLLPAVASADDVSANRADALPFVNAALTAPMSDLGDKALKKAPGDALRFGLALLAGRTNMIATDVADDEARLQALEVRIAPSIGDYLKAHPGANAMQVNWPQIVHETPEEAAFVEHYLQVHSADYWLENAVYAINAREGYVPRHATLDVQANAQARTYDVLNMEKAIETNVILTAAHCVVAVRREAGTAYQPWSTLPLSIRLLQTLPRQDMQARVDLDIANKDVYYKYSTGAAACGTDDQFKADVAALKTAVQ